MTLHNITISTAKYSTNNIAGFGARKTTKFYDHEYLVLPHNYVVHDWMLVSNVTIIYYIILHDINNNSGGQKFKMLYNYSYSASHE